jgi:hypothetical protein
VTSNFSLILMFPPVSCVVVVHMPDPAQLSLIHHKVLYSSDSGMHMPIDTRQNWIPNEFKEDIQTTRTLSPFTLDVPRAKEPLPVSSLAVPRTWFPSNQGQDCAFIDAQEALTRRNAFHKEFEMTSEKENQTAGFPATPRSHSHARSQGRVGFYSESLENAHGNWKSSLLISAPKSQSFGTNRRHETELVACDTCQTVDKLYTRTRMSPCGVSRSRNSFEDVSDTSCLQHLACFLCLTASINIVGASGTLARCTYCHSVVLDFSPGQKNHRELSQAKNTVDAILKALQPDLTSPGHASASVQAPYSSTPVIMRIDNVAWDATPDMVEQFLPPGVLADTAQPVHLLIVREDGRSRDYLVCY